MSSASGLKSIPLLTLDTYQYTEAKKFSKELDHVLGFEIERVENQILNHTKNTPWAGLDPQALQTPYPEIRIMLSMLNLKPGHRVVDLGAGYGRMGLVISEFFPEVQFLGFEISQERVEEGRRIYQLLGVQNSELICTDMSTSQFKLPDADIYFIYDFGNLESIIRVIDRLKVISQLKPIRVIGRGRRTRDQIERHEPWLSQVNPPQHCGNFSIYYPN